MEGGFQQCETKKIVNAFIVFKSVLPLLRKFGVFMEIFKEIDILRKF